MGSKHHDRLPQTYWYKRLVRILDTGEPVEGVGTGGVGGTGTGGTGRESGSDGGPMGLLAQLSAATLVAAKAGLERAKTDEGVVYCVHLLAEVARAADEPDFAGALRRIGVRIGSRAGSRYDVTSPAKERSDFTVYDLATGFSEAVDEHLDSRGVRNDLAEMARLAATESLSAICRPAEAKPVASKAAALQSTLRDLSSQSGFASLSHDFFSRWIRRYIEYHLSRELSSHVGTGLRFQSVSQHNEFLTQLGVHCRTATAPVRDFADSWFGDHGFAAPISLRDCRQFTSSAIDTVRGSICAAGSATSTGRLGMQFERYRPARKLNGGGVRGGDGKAGGGGKGGVGA